MAPPARALTVVNRRVAVPVWCMATLRVLIALWLSFTVPVTALASLMNVEHCQRGMQVTTSPGHGGHAIPADMQLQGSEHALHMANAGTAVDSSNTDCSCGCNCSVTHCATSCSAVLIRSGLRDSFFSDRGIWLVDSPSSHPLAAHHSDILRPPSLS